MIKPDTLNKTVFLVEDPHQWACRYSDRPTLATPLFIERDPATGLVRLMDIQGGVDPDWSLPEHLGVDLTGGYFGMPVPMDLWRAAEALLQAGRPADAMMTVVSSLAHTDGNWDEFHDAVQRDRYEVNVWIERDNRQITLTDLLSGNDVFCLTDEEFDSAIESGYLSRPRGPRPQERDWLNPAIDYGTQIGLIKDPGEFVVALPDVKRPAPVEN